MWQTFIPKKSLLALCKFRILEPDLECEINYQLYSYSRTQGWLFTLNSNVEFIGWIELDKILLLINNFKLIDKALDNLSIYNTISSQDARKAEEKQDLQNEVGFIRDLLTKLKS